MSHISLISNIWDSFEEQLNHKRVGKVEGDFELNEMRKLYETDEPT